MGKYSIHKPAKKFSLIALVTVIFVVIVTAFSGFFAFNRWYENSLKPVGSAVKEQKFTVSEGESSQVIAARLFEAGLIKNERAFSLYISREGDLTLKTGTYYLSPHLSVQEIAGILHEGREETIFVTIPPGLRLDQVKNVLVDSGFKPAEVDKAFAKRYKHPLFKDLPAKADLEGYIFPETIQITPQTTVEQLLERHFDAFYHNLDSKLLNNIKKQGLSLHEAVILASVIQREISDPDTQPAIAGIFHNRLDIDMPLGADATFFYAAEILGVEPAVDLDSPYNTRLYKGLPPGPIANFNFSALEAVANPEKSDYLFFVSGDDGNTYFAETEEKHIENTQKYCIELCKL